MSSILDQETALDARGVTGREEAFAKVLGFVKKVSENSEFEDTVHFSVATHGKGSIETIGTVGLVAGPSPEDIHTVAEQIVDMALDDGMDAAHGTAKYLVTLVGHMGRVVFSLKFTEKGVDDFSEDADEMGLASQAMRHSEAFAAEMRNMVGEVREMARDSLNSVRAINQDLLAENRSIRATAVESMKVYGELVEAKGVRDLALRRAERDDGHKEKVLGMLGAAVPHILHRLGVAAPQEGPFGEELTKFLSTMRRDQLDAIGAGKRPEMTTDQQAGLMQLLAFLDSERQRIAAVKAMNHAADSEGGEGTH